MLRNGEIDERSFCYPNQIKPGPGSSYNLLRIFMGF